MLDTTGRQPKTAEQLKNEEFVRSLVAFQNAHGSFDISNWDNEHSPICQEVRQGIYYAISRLESRTGEFHSVATTIVIVTLLQEKFPSCKDLWKLITEKARLYVETAMLSSSSLAMLEHEARCALSDAFETKDIVNYLTTLPQSKPSRRMRFGSLSLLPSQVRTSELSQRIKALHPVKGLLRALKPVPPSSRDSEDTKATSPVKSPVLGKLGDSRDARQQQTLPTAKVALPSPDVELNRAPLNF